MSRPTKHSPERGNASVRLLEAARNLIRRKGYAATTIDDLCQEAEVTKGAFFHHFKSKEALGIAAARFWDETTSTLFADAPYNSADDPLDRVLAYLDFRRSIISGDTSEWTCLVGTMVQEVYASNPPIRDACAESILGHAATLERDIQAAREQHGIESDWTAESLARHTQAVLQGGFILAKATGDADLARDSVDHLIRYVRALFGRNLKPNTSKTMEN